MTKPVPCINRPHRTQRGDALMEALVALLLTSILGLGLSYAASRVLAAQRYAMAHGIALAQMRHLLETVGVPGLCAAGSAPTLTIAPTNGSAVQVALETAGCTAENVGIATANADLNLTLANAAVTRLTLSTASTASADALLGAGPLVLRQ